MTNRFAFAWVALAIFASCALSSCTKRQKLQSVSGQIEIAPLLARLAIHKNAALFLIARAAGDTSGPPIAVKRFTAPFHFPVAFTISPQDEMIPGVPFEGPFDITARLAQSGSATPAEKGDFESGADGGSVAVGSNGVEIRLAQVRQ